eukprot:jgi/Tetstr1/464012/TSEL_008817.t1
MTKLHWQYRRKLDKILDSRIPDSCRYARRACATYREVIDRISHGGERKVFASGGLIRDIVTGEDISNADVDIKFGKMSKKALRSVFDDMGLAMRVDAKKTYTYFFVGCDPDNQLEGHMLIPGKPEDIESPANALMVDLADMTLLDPTGHGLEDAREKVWRIPPDADRDGWIDRPSGVRLLWRMIKFRLRGYRVPPRDVEFIYKKFASAVREKKVKKSDYRNLINQVPDPGDALRVMAEDSVKGLGAEDDINLVVSELMGSGEVWKRVEAEGNVPFQTVCRGIREAEIAKRQKKKANAKAKAKGRGKRSKS